MAENLNLKTIDTVDTRPFKKLVMTIGELPTSFVESMTYYELLAWFVNYLETVIIPTVNNNAEAVQELQNLFVELRKFVDDYFDNLDVQDEIDNKLDQMASDGTLEEIITTYIRSNVAWTFDTVADMKLATNLIDGSFAQTFGFHSLNDGGEASYKIRTLGENETADEITIITIGDGDLVAELQITKNITPNQFGAYGDGDHDDSDAMQAYIDNAKTGRNIYLNVHKYVYKITKTLDFNGKGIVGSGLAGFYDVNKGGLKFVAGTYTDNVAMKNVGNTIQDICISATDLSDVDGILLKTGYDVNITRVAMSGFKDQVVVNNITVAFRVDTFEGSGFTGNSFHILDPNNQQSTTTYFNKCMWYQASGKAITFEHEVYNCSFTDLIFENINGGISGDLFYDCTFETIWGEGTYDDNAHDWLVNNTSQQIQSCNFRTLYIRSPWTNRVANELASSNNTGGVAQHQNGLICSDSTGQSVVMDNKGIHTRHNDWLVANKRPLIITTQGTATETSYKTPIHIKAPNGNLFLKNQDDSTTAVTIKRVVGDNSGNEVIGTDKYDLTEKTWTHTDPVSSNTTNFKAFMVFNYDQRNTTPANGQWSISREGLGTFRLTRANGSSALLNNPSIIVSGAINSTPNGDGSPLVSGFQLINEYSGQYASYSLCKEIVIKFYDMSSQLVDPTKFTLAITQK